MKSKALRLGNLKIVWLSPWTLKYEQTAICAICHLILAATQWRIFEIGEKFHARTIKLFKEPRENVLIFRSGLSACMLGVIFTVVESGAV